MMKLKHYDYTGRIDQPDVKERIHQVIAAFHEKDNKEIKRPVFIGFSSDEGVRRNKGRTGAKEAPFKVREFLSSMPYTETVYDYGTIIGDENLEASQASLGEAVSEVLESGNFPLIIGGGHETLFGHYLGIRQAFPNAKTVVVNFDAHFDLRNERPSSGTMFHQILESDNNIDYYVFGIQKSGNTKTLFDTADRFDVKYSVMDEVRESNVFEERLEEITSEYDIVFATLCMDSVQESTAPGVSAPSANGFTSQEIHSLTKKLSSIKNLVSFDISEVNPKLDINDRTSRLAASIFHSFLTSKEY